MEENPRAAAQIDEVVETELTRFWLAHGERLLLACPPVRAHVGACIGGRRLVPYIPRKELPSMREQPRRWPLPMEDLPVEDWVDESHEAARKAYRDPASRDRLRPGARIGREYQDANLPVATRRLAQAGIAVPRTPRLMVRNRSPSVGTGSLVSLNLNTALLKSRGRWR